MPSTVRLRPAFRFERAPGGARSLVRLARGILLLVGVGLLGWCALAYLEARTYQRSSERTLLEMRRQAPATETSSEVRPDAPQAGPAAGSVASQVRETVDPGLIGRLEIRRLGLAAIVREGTDRRTLDLAVGHVVGSALPGERGNVCLAAHRDTFFRRLEGVRKGDSIRITTPDAVWDYTVESLSVVEPGAIDVLASTENAALTLVTCFPFGYVGPAPRRFIVSASLAASPSNRRR
jgi:sortase A